MDRYEPKSEKCPGCGGRGVIEVPSTNVFDCLTCKGKRYVPGPKTDGPDVKCPQCKGSGCQSEKITDTIMCKPCKGAGVIWY